MEAETKLYDCESADCKAVMIIVNPGSEKKSSLDRDEPPIHTHTASTVSRGAEGVERRYKKWLHAEIVGLIVLIIIVWGLLLLPVVFYYLPDIDVRPYIHVSVHASPICYIASHWKIILLNICNNVNHA